MFKLNQIKSTPKRDGISIIEVLTSMAVATIGVFGVMVMIPFAVKQSQSGLDADAANALGRNAVEEMQIRGLLAIEDNNDFSRLLIGTAGGGTVACNSANFATPAAPGLFHFDPVGFASGLNSFTITDASGDVVISSVTASRGVPLDLNGDGDALDFDEPATSPLRLVGSRLLCQSRDDQVYSEDDAGFETAPPQPIFDVNGINSVKRQALGRISWSAFFVPEKNPSLSSAPTRRFRSYTLAYRDRFISPGPAPVVSNRDFIPDPGPGSSYDYYQVDNSAGRGFEPNVSQLTLMGLVDTDELDRGDWVMLVNRIPAPTVPGGNLNTSVTPSVRAADAGYREQLMFARVTRIANVAGVGVVTIDGGAFDFVTSGLIGHTGLPSSETYMVHLKDVVNVFERSVAAEF